MNHEHQYFFGPDRIWRCECDEYLVFSIIDGHPAFQTVHAPPRGAKLVLPQRVVRPQKPDRVSLDGARAGGSHMASATADDPTPVVTAPWDDTPHRHTVAAE